MPFTEKDVQYIAELAHLELTGEEVKGFKPQLDAILEYMQTLNQADTANVEPMAQVVAPGKPNPAIRADHNLPSFPQAIALANAPEPGPGLFRVPSVIERD
ncbi:MAG: Asp-tRNA(Asn)/Glu-tRNA(Gln) amidotransferase subunit GatC [Terriglobia bacterium]